ncbi:DUF72 domain-containing protein [Mucilaginibacter pallidiroseus]|nr:DUF72 domain-containing protein [Mucilaginibacter pallidiroseus]
MLAISKNDEPLKIYIGAPKWGERSWKGIIYPKRAKDSELLTLYADSFKTIEFGATFYTISSADKIQEWAQQVAGSPGFKFCPKFPQIITHARRLNHTTKEFTEQFYNSLTGFGDHLGPLMMQLSEHFSPKYYDVLKAYLETLDPAIPVHVEVRNKNWFADSVERKRLFDLFRNLNIGTVISDTSGRRDVVHMELTTNRAMIRFVGNDLAESDYKRLNDWIDRIKEWRDMGLKSLWFFMHQDNEKFVPQASSYFINHLNNKLGTDIALPKMITE